MDSTSVRVLMVAFHFPPYQGSSGVLRTWNFARYLPEFGCTPIVLTAGEAAYESTGGVTEGGLTVPPGTLVSRAFARDLVRSLSIRGRYPAWFARPDRWFLTWYLPAVIRGLRLIRRWRPQVIWSTYPISSAHIIALSLHRLTGLPWVADFRDSMTEDAYPADPRQRAIYRWIERRTVAHAAQVVFTTPGTLAMYEQRYLHEPHGALSVIENGYDEESFAALPPPATRLASAAGPRVLLHSGVIYPSERDPRPFLQAVGRLKRAGTIDRSTLRIIFRATGHDTYIQSLIDAERVGDVVELAGTVPYGQALQEMVSVDGLLLFQAANSNHQIPAKLYEYLRAGRPILALASAAGDAAATLRAAGMGDIAELHDADDIEQKLAAFLRRLANGTAARPDPDVVRKHSRRAQTGQLAGLFTTLAGVQPMSAATDIA